MSFGEIFVWDGVSNGLEHLIMSALILVTGYRFYYAWRKISRDTSNLVDETDRLIFYHSCAQIGILLLFYIVMKASLFTYTYKAARFGQEILVCYIISLLLFEESYQPLIKKLVYVVYIFNGLLWFLGVFGTTANSQAFECSQFVWLAFSISTLILSGLSAYFGYEVSRMRGRGQTTGGEYYPMPVETPGGDNAMIANPKASSPQRQLLHLINIDEINRRKRQVEILVAGNIVSSLMLFFWDYYSYMHATDSEDCTRYYETSSGFTMILFVIVKTLAWIFPIWTIYYIFYWNNRSYFNTIDPETQERHMSVFFDERSDL